MGKYPPVIRDQMQARNMSCHLMASSKKERPDHQKNTDSGDLYYGEPELHFTKPFDSDHVHQCHYTQSA
ncbi:hypothetical protein D3C73_1262520 [compost metagenome]